MTKILFFNEDNLLIGCEFRRTFSLKKIFTALKCLKTGFSEAKNFYMYFSSMKL